MNHSGSQVQNFFSRHIDILIILKMQVFGHIEMRIFLSVIT